MSKNLTAPDLPSGKTVRFYIGTYSEEGPYVPRANGEGVVSCRLDLRSGHIRKDEVCEDAVNSTYLAKSPDGKFIFVAGDRFSSAGEVMVLSAGADGAISVLSSQSSHGRSTCHIACDREGSTVFASSYMDGKVTIHRFNGKKVFPASQVVTYEGSGPNPGRQEASHAHQALVSPDNQWLYVCDLGSDKIWIHEVSSILEDTCRVKSIAVPAGYGPRHLVWHAELPRAYVFCELNSHILVYDRDDQTGMMTLLEDNAALPDEYHGEAAGAAIRLHPSNKALYVSDRGQNSIIVHRVDEADGSLEYESWFPAGGKTPRDFGIDPTGRWLLAASQDSDRVVPFRLDPESGLPAGESAAPFECGTPACVLFQKLKNGNR